MEHPSIKAIIKSFQKYFKKSYKEHKVIFEDIQAFILIIQGADMNIIATFEAELKEKVSFMKEQFEYMKTSEKLTE